MGLVPASSGQIEIDGEPLAGKTEDQLNRIRMKMGMCFQQAALFDSMNVYENIAFGLKRLARLSREQIVGRVEEFLETVGLTGFADYMPADLSGGMKKRVGMARALAVQPDIVLYDEPTSGLDPIIAGQINTLISQLGRRLGTTSIVVTHEVRRLFSIADRVLMIADKTVAAVDTPERLLETDDQRLRQFFADEMAGLAEACADTSRTAAPE
jgi:phospholipid/cholesterol/gamma-HCH transport system ATP-binding protein